MFSLTTIMVRLNWVRVGSGSLDTCQLLNWHWVSSQSTHGQNKHLVPAFQSICS